MKKRVIAMLAMLALAVSLSVSMVSASTPATYDVGYAKVDINPYEDTNDNGIIDEEERKAGTLLGLPMGGYDDTSTRLSNGKVDDNGDGKVDENDGLFATCIAVTDKSGKTALLFNLDMLSAYTEYVSRVRNILLSDEYFAEFGLTADRILFNGSHSHNTPQMTSGFSNSTYSFAADYVTYRTLLVDQLVNAAKLALEDRAPATMYKGTIDASESEAKNGPVGDTLNANLKAAGSATQVAELTDAQYTSDREYNAVRHYKVTAQETDSNYNVISGGKTINYVAGSAFNGDYEGVGTKKTSTDSQGNTRYWKITGYQEVSKADDKMHILEFRFEAEDKDPIALINWRCHLIGLSDETTTKTYWKVSSSQIGSLRYTLEQAGYRAAYFQGAAGNVVSYSYLSPGSWMRSSATNHADNRHNIYGTELAEVALELLTSDNMTQINENGGEINGLQSFYQTERKTVSVFEYLAGLQYKIAYYNDEGGGNRTYNGLYYYTDAEGTPLISTTVSVTDNVSKGTATITDSVTVDGKKTNFTPAAANAGLLYQNTTTLATGTKVTQDKAVVITSIYHANHLVDGYLANDTAGQEIELYALTIGDGFSLVAASGEPFDRYSDSASLTDNKWDTLGVDFVMGYTNNGTGYLGSKATFSFSEDAEQYGFAVGTYETLRNPFVAGEGEKMLNQLDLMLDFLKDGTTSATTDTTCTHCDKRVTWTKLTKEEMQSGELSLTQIIRSGHYILAEDITWDDMETMEGADVCLNLNSKTLTVKKAIEVKGYSTLSIMGDGIVDGYEGKQYGGVFAVDNTATLNQYGGTFRYSGETTVYPGYSPAIKYDGGILFVEGVFNMYGGKIEGSQVNWVGGAIYVDTEGVANFRGGEVTEYTGGSAAYIAPCVGNLGVVSLGGNANISQIYIDYRPDGSPDLGDALVFDGEFTGSVNIHARKGEPTQLGVDVGNAINNADISRATIKVNNATEYAPQIQGTDIYLTDAHKYVATNADTGAVTFGNDFSVLANTVAAGSTIALQSDSVDNINVSKNLNLELNGHTVSGTVTVAEGVTLYVTDAATADYNITDNKYGKIKISEESKGTVAGKPATDDNDVYLMLEEENGYVSFHAVDLNINIMSLKPELQGIYYKHEFVADESVTNLVKGDGCYGIALSLTEAALEDAALQEQLNATKDVEAEGCVVKGESVVLTRFTGNFGSSISTSTIVTGIMKEENGYTTNRRTSKTPICGRAYVRLDDGTYLMGATRKLTLQELVEAFDDQWSKLSSAQQNNLLRMYKTNAYYKVMRYWDIPNIKNPTQSEVEQETLRILAVGNSHTGDATAMLAEVFAAEKPEQKVMIGNLYKSGCKVAEHVTYAKNNTVIYTYYKNENRVWSPSIQTTTSSATFKKSLQDQQWDVVVLHEMNTTGILASTYNNSNLQTHINNIKSNSLTQPKLLWNLSWANPTGETFLAEGDTKYDKWSSNYEANSNTDYATMFSQLVDNANNCVMTNGNISGMIPTGTAICYARNQLNLKEEQLYRDYTHMSDLGRLISAYVWYATLTNQTEITEVNVDSIPGSLCEESRSDGFAVTPEMKEIIKESVNFALKNPCEVSVAG